MLMVSPAGCVQMRGSCGCQAGSEPNQDAPPGLVSFETAGMVRSGSPQTLRQISAQIFVLAQSSQRFRCQSPVSDPALRDQPAAQRFWKVRVLSGECQPSAATLPSG